MRGIFGDINITIATDIKGMGGIATVLNVYNDNGFFKKWNVRLISTHIEDSGFLGLRKAAIFLSSIFKISFYLIFFNVGLVHIHMASRGSYLRKSLIIRLVKFFGRKIILHLHGGGFDKFYLHECSHRKQAHIRRSFELADFVIVIAKPWLAWAKNTFDKTDHVRVIYNGVPSLYADRGEELGLVCFLGRISKEKGVFDLIKAFVKVLQTCPDAKLVLAGNGDISSCKKEAESLGISDSVHFPGWISGKDKVTLLSKADVYCQPSYFEALGLGILEAMSVGTPVVATNIGGIPDAITDTKEGLLVEPGDVDALSEAITRLIQGRELNKTYSEAAKSKFKGTFSLDAVMPQLDALYSELLGDTT